MFATYVILSLHEVSIHRYMSSFAISISIGIHRDTHFIYLLLGWCRMLTSFISKSVDVFSTLRTVVGTLLMLFQTSPTQHLSTAGNLLWVSGHTQADQTEEVVWRYLHKLMVVAFQLFSTGCHDQLGSVVFNVMHARRNSHVRSIDGIHPDYRLSVGMIICTSMYGLLP